MLKKFNVQIPVRPCDLQPEDPQPGDLRPADLRPDDLPPEDLRPEDLLPNDPPRREAERQNPGGKNPGGRSSRGPSQNARVWEEFREPDAKNSMTSPRVVSVSVCVFPMGQDRTCVASWLNYFQQVFAHCPTPCPSGLECLEQVQE